MSTIEIRELVVVSAGRAETPRPPCPVCAAQMMVTPEEAAAIARVTVRSVYARVETEGVHFLETADGLLLLCVNSLGQTEWFGALKNLIGATDPGVPSPTGKE